MLFDGAVRFAEKGKVDLEDQNFEASYDALVEALSSYGGALVVASHDEVFLADAGVDRVVDLGATGGPGQADETG